MTLAQIDGKDSLGHIGPLIRDKSAGVRLAVVRALARMKSRKVLPVLFVALRDRDPQIRLAAVDALGRSGRAEARDQLLYLLADRDPAIRRACRAALRRLGMDRGAQVEALAKVRLRSLLSAANAKQPAIRADAAEQLGRCGLPEVLPVLRRLLSDSSALVADEALVALANVGTKPALQLVRRALASKQFKVEDRLVAALANLEPAQWAQVADLLPLDKIVPLAVGLEEVCRTGSSCPVRCDLLCRWIAAPAWRAARSAWLAARSRSCPCAPRRLASLTDPEKRVFLLLSAGRTVTEADLSALTAKYEKTLPAAAMGPLLAQLPESLRELVRRRALERVRSYIEDSVSWLSEKDWQALEKDPGAEPLGRAPAKPQDKRARKLARLLASYRPRSWKDVNLLPPSVPRAGAEAALDVLGWLSGADADLLGFAARGPLSLRSRALSALAERPRKVDQTLVAVIRAALGGPVPLRAAAARALRSAKDKAVVMLAQLLRRDPSSEVRASAAESLAAIDLPGCRKALRSAFQRRPEPAVVRALVATGDGSAAHLLLKALKAHPDGLELRLLLIDALGRLGSRDSSELSKALVEQLSHPNTKVRAAAARALGFLASPLAISELKVCTHDFSGLVRRACRRALVRCSRRNGG